MPYTDRKESTIENTNDNLATNIYKNTYYYVICIVLSYIFYMLFYFQAIATNLQYLSDLPAHINFAQNLFNASPISYPIFHILILILNKLPFINLFSGSAIILSISCIVTSFIIRWIFIKLLNKGKSNYLIDFFSICLILIFTIQLPSYSNYIYYMIGGINVWHNPTYLVMKPFAILSFFMFVLLYEKYMKGQKYIKLLVFFAVITFLSALAKPSYLFVFLPALAIFLVIELIITKFKTFKLSLLIAVCVIPMFILLLYQFSISFTAHDGSIVYKLGGVWSNSLKEAIISILLVNAFSIFVLIFGGFKGIIRDKKYFLAVLTALVGCFEFYFLIQSGRAANDGNLAWGYYIGALIFTIISTYKFVFEMKPKPFIKNVGLGIFSVQLIAGLYYFYTLLLGKSFL